VVHGKSNLLHKMPGDDWQKFANVRALLAYMWTHPGKKTIFMGMEFGQRAEWNVLGDLQWDLLQHEPHQGLQRIGGRPQRLLQSGAGPLGRRFQPVRLPVD
jgi:1,4-alpha-glucan branching enzyme